ncbi:Copia protein [Vitis vinifera]|uniref:Copia protein n=1 Tax=Vitis vinifera TaxID=29760 RepID=A0A438ECC8_VITVI|nr:Copia protein [Vitis vinifera]
MKQEQYRILKYMDADWAASVDNRRSTFGYCTFVWGNLVTWRSKKQNAMARSNAEVEYRAVSQAAINISHNPVHHDRMKHVEVNHHFIKEKLEEGTICITYIPFAQQAANLLTKALTRPAFEKLQDKLGLLNIFVPA